MSKGALRFRSTADMPDAMRRRVEAQLAPAVVQPLKRHQIVDPTPTAEKWQHRRHAKHTSGVMNKTEARYAQHLEGLKLTGEVVWWGFEVMKLRLAPRTFLTVDFLVQPASGPLEAVDVKGRKGARFWAEEDAMVKLKVAPTLIPCFVFRIAWPAKGGGWESQLLGPREVQAHA